MTENSNHAHHNPIEHHNLTKAATDIVLVVVETLLTLLLRFDASLRQQVYPLAQDNTVVCIRSYVPHVTIYATFTVNGILLDTNLQPNQQVDVTINGFTWQIAQAIFTHKTQVVEQLQIRGEEEQVAQLKNFLSSIGLAQVVQNILQSVKGNKAEKSSEDKPKVTVNDYRQQVEELKTQTSEMNVKTTQLATQVLELQSKNKFLKTCLGVVFALFIVCLIGWIMK